MPNQDTINCQKSILTLNANSSVNPPLSTLKWRAFKNGHIIGVDTLLNIQLDSTGSYELKVTNNINGCIGLDTSFIFKDLAKPIFNLNSPDTLSCTKDSVQLSTNLIDYNLYEYEWKTTDGILDNDLDKYTTWAKAAGNYTLIIKNKFNKCLDSLSVKVEADKGVPIAFIDQPLKLSCGKKILNLDGSKSSSGGNITYSWTTIGGNIVSGDSTNKIIIDKTGDYKIVVQNTTNGCVKSYNVLVEIDTLKPMVQIATPEELSCIKATIELDGSNSSTGNNFQYKWTTLNGNIVGSNTTIKTSASKTGTYNLVVTDSLNGCSNNLSIDVKNDTTKPTAIIQTADTLNCINNQLVIDGSKSSKGNRYRYQWSPISGNIVGGSTNLNPTIDQPGNYKLVVTDTILGCKDSANILVIQDITKPKAKLDLPLTLNCKDTLIQINGGNSTTNSGSTKYSWSSLKNGSIGSSNSSINVNSPDTYSLQIVDLKNGCIDSSSITVNQNIKKPAFTLDTGLILTCIIPSVDINSKITIGAGPFGYLWTTTNGNILTSNTLNTIKVDKSANYLLTIIDSSNYCQENLSTNIGLNKNLPIVALNNPATLNCLDTLSKLLSTGSSTGNEFTYNWTTQNGKIVGSNSDLNVDAAQPGNYTLIISNKNNGCIDSLKTIVNQDIKKPTIQLLPPNEINCLQKIVQVDGSNSSSGKQYNYNWTTKDGNIIGSNTSQKIDVDKPGYYSLIIHDNSNFCTKTDSILVTKSADVPIASIDKVDTLNCKVKTINIDGSKSTQGAAFNLQWSATNGGKIIGNSNNNLISTDAPGTYILIVTNISNNCKDTGSIIVAQNIQKPLANATVNDTLSCKKTNLNLNGSNSVAKSIKYNWFTNSGNFTSATNIVSPTVNKAALYQLEIEDLTNFCKDTTSINVLEDIAKPIITLLPTDTLSCKKNSILVASNSSTDYLYNWKGNSILSGQNTNQINVDKSGNYQVVITSKRNGCKDSASVLVNENFVKPIASIQSATILNCINTSVDLNGNGSSSGAKFTYDWTTTNGNIVGSKNTISTKVDKAGVYNLLVTDQVNGCQTNTNITVKQDTIQPIVTIPTPAEITCIKTNIQLIANSNTNFNYQWNTNNGNIVSNKFTNSITVNKKGDYVVTVVNPTNGCSKIATTNVTDFINYPYVDAGTDQQLNCKTNKATLTALDKNIGNFSYLWKNSFGAIVSKAKEAIVGSLGTYTYTVKNEDNGCEKTDTVIVFQNRPDAMTLKVTSPKCGETRGSIDVLSVSGGTPSYGFLYGNLVVPGGAHIPHLLPGTYAITVVDANQCTFSTKATVVAPTGFDLKINGEVSVLPGDSIQLHVEANVPKSRIDTLIWSYSNTLNLNDIWNPYAKPEGITRYDVIAIDTNNCRDSAFVVVGIDHPDVYIPNIFTPGNGDGVNDIFMVYSRKEKILKINYLEIFDRWGNKIFTVQNFLPDDALYGWDGTFNNKLMNPGVYVYVTEVEYKDGKKKVYKGDVTLIRE
ncbi:MAG: gliding motility-associated C-terminal domain-containing protein [Saprospiraceae bacterium]|nr:gliding motility-associated C-terminal domain-containing protein [Saprospiraceae bacterium]